MLDMVMEILPSPLDVEAIEGKILKLIMKKVENLL